MPRKSRIGLRPWFRRHIYHIFLGVGLAFTIFLGLAPFYAYYNAPGYSFHPSFSGFGVARNYTANIQPYYLTITIGVEPRELFFQYLFSCSENGTYNFLFIFPFKVTNKISSTENMDFNATSKGTAVWLQYPVNNVRQGWMHQDIWGYFSIETTFQSGTRGSFMFILPFGGGIRREVVGNLQRELGVTFHSPDSDVELGFAIPAWLQIRQTFPELSEGPEPFVTPDNVSKTTVGWRFENLRDSVTIYCENPQEVSLYQNFLFISGLGLGIGVPTMTTTFYDAAKTWAKKPSKDGDQKEKKAAQQETPKDEEETEESYDETILRLISLVDDNFRFSMMDALFRGNMAIPSISLISILIFILLYVAFAPYPEGIHVTVAFIGFLAGYFSLMRHALKVHILKVNFERFGTYVKEDEKPLLRALIKMKAKNQSVDLKRIYSMNDSMFNKKKLLESLYE